MGIGFGTGPVTGRNVPSRRPRKRYRSTGHPGKLLNQMATKARPTESDPALLSALTVVIEGLADAANHYTVSANYYDHQTPERLGERWYIAQIWLNAQTSSEVALTQQGLVCSVRLNQHNLEQISQILLPYDQIWSVQSAGDKVAQLYYRSDKLNLVRPGLTGGHLN